VERQAGGLLKGYSMIKSHESDRRRSDDDDDDEMGRQADKSRVVSTAALELRKGLHQPIA
jgi:hypothetical protein